MPAVVVCTKTCIIRKRLKFPSVNVLNFVFAMTMGVFSFFGDEWATASTMAFIRFECSIEIRDKLQRLWMIGKKINFFSSSSRHIFIDLVYSLRTFLLTFIYYKLHFSLYSFIKFATHLFLNAEKKCISYSLQCCICDLFVFICELIYFITRHKWAHHILK